MDWIARPEIRRVTNPVAQVAEMAWATGYNVLAIPLAAGVLASRGMVLSPAAAAVLMSVSTLIVAINELLRRTRL